MAKLRKMLNQIFGRRLKDVRGIRQNKIGGMPRTLLFALMSNIDAHGQYCREHPDFARWLVQHSLDTDDLETSFGMLVMRCRWKPTYEVAVRSQIAVDHLQRMRMLDAVTRGFALPGGGARKCSIQIRKLAIRKMWSDGRICGRDRQAVQLRGQIFHELRKKVRRATRAKVSARSRRLVLALR